MDCCLPLLNKLLKMYHTCVVKYKVWNKKHVIYNNKEIFIVTVLLHAIELLNLRNV